MSLASDIPWPVEFYGIMTGFFALFLALMYSGARWSVKQLRAMGRGEVAYYYRFIELIDRVKPLALPGGIIAFVGGVGLQILFERPLANAGALVGFGGYILLLFVTLAWIAKKGVEAGESADVDDVDPFHGPLGLPNWITGTAINYVISGVVFAFFWQAGMFHDWFLAPLLWAMVPMAVIGTPIILYYRYQSLEQDSRSGK